MLTNQKMTPGSKRIQFPLGTQIPLDIVGSTHFGRYQKISSEETFNMIMSDDALVHFAGYKAVAEIAPSGEAREIYPSVRYQHMIVVLGNGVYEINKNLAVAKIGEINTFVGIVFIAENDTGQIAIADGLNIYIFDYNTATFGQASTDFRPVYVSFQDGRFISADGNTNQWRLSQVGNGLIWPDDGQHVGLLETKPCNTVACVPLDRQLYIFGQTVTEPWYDVGASLFPYQRSNFYNIDYGCVCPETIAAAFSIMVWLGSNEKGGFALMYSSGGMATKISTDGLDFLFSHLVAPQDSFGFLCRIDGHVCYFLTFRTDNLTYMYDFNTQRFFTFTDQNLNHFIAKRIAFFNDNYYFVSFTDSKLYELNSEFLNYDGHTIPRARTITPKRFGSSDYFIVPNVTLTLEEGIGQPIQRVLLAVSRDGGASYGNYVANRMNPWGKRKGLFQFWRLGMANDLTLKFSFWGDSRFAVIGGVMTVYQ